jgi:hypothetical protein
MVTHDACWVFSYIRKESLPFFYQLLVEGDTVCGIIVKEDLYRNTGKLKSMFNLNSKRWSQIMMLVGCFLASERNAGLSFTSVS